MPGGCSVASLQEAKNNLATRNRTRDHLISAEFYSQMLCQLSYGQLGRIFYHMLHIIISVLGGWWVVVVLVMGGWLVVGCV